MIRLIATFFASAFILESAFGVQYEIPRSSVDVRIVELEGHKYVVGAIVGEFCSEGYKEGIGGSGSAISVLHFEGCQCKSSKPIASTEPRLFPKSMRLRKYEEQNGICPHCTNRFEFAEMQGDHIVPYSKGGKTEYSNLQMLCAPCNRKKSNKYSY